MANQAPLFGKSFVREPIFKNAENSAYYQVVNALLQIEAAGNKEKFLKSAQKKMEGKVYCGCVISRGTAGKSKEMRGIDAPVISVLQGLAAKSNEYERKTVQWC